MSDLITAMPADERISIKHFSEKAYLDYSMYVILDRALPHLGDNVLLDDRAGVSPGVKMKDADLIGIPRQLILGKSMASEDRLVEVIDRTRCGNQTTLVPWDQVLDLFKPAS